MNQKYKSNRLRKALRDTDKNPEYILTLGETLELADSQISRMERETVNNVQRTKHKNKIKTLQHYNTHRKGNPDYTHTHKNPLNHRTTAINLETGIKCCKR